MCLRFYLDSIFHLPGDMPAVWRALIFGILVTSIKLAHAWVVDIGVVQRLIQHLNVPSLPNFAQLSSTPTSF